MKKNKIENLIKESMGTSYSSPEEGGSYDFYKKVNPMRMSLVDILKADRGVGDKARKILPHEMQTTFEKLLYLSDQLDSLKSDFIRAYSNPILKKDDERKQRIKEMVKELNNANEIYKKIISDLDQIQM